MAGAITGAPSSGSAGEQTGPPELLDVVLDEELVEEELVEEELLEVVVLLLDDVVLVVLLEEDELLVLIPPPIPPVPPTPPAPPVPPVPGAPPAPPAPPVPLVLVLVVLAVVVALVALLPPLPPAPLLDEEVEMLMTLSPQPAVTAPRDTNATSGMRVFMGSRRYHWWAASRSRAAITASMTETFSLRAARDR